jgi:serine/threonine-protein kinase
MRPDPAVDRQVDGNKPGFRMPHQRRSLAVVFFGSTEQRVEAVAVAIIILVGLGYWTYAGVKESLESVRTASLRTVLESKVAALEVWVDAKRAEAERCAAEPVIVDAVRGLDAAARAGAAGEVVRASPGRDRLVKALTPCLANRENVAVNVVDREGRILATPVESYEGPRVGASMLADLAPVFKGETRLISPRPEAGRVPQASKQAFERPIVWFAAPVRDADRRVIAALELGTYADTRFAGILGVSELADTTSTADAYAFDDSGLLLTEPRHATALRNVLPAGARGAAAFNVKLRDPGRDLTQGASPPADLEERPLTAIVERAIASRGDSDPRAHHGVLLEPHRNYVGREVISAWQWLPAYDIGIAVEVDMEEAYAPLRYLTTALLVIFAMLVIAVAVALASTFSIASLRRETRQLGQYRLEKQIAEGGQATVHRAFHALLRRPTAVKILKAHLATDELIARFEREVQLASRLAHPATVEIYDYGRTRDGTFFYAMEYIDGITLAELLEKDGPQPVPRVAHILKAVCESLREAHGMGFVHRDIKPGNVMLCERGGVADVVKVLDFGLIKDIYATDTRDLTQYATLLGTPLYMAPERIRDPADADARADIYAVGVLAFLLLSGKRVFDAPNELELKRQILEVEAPRVSSATRRPIPKALDDVIARSLAKERAHRPQHVDELIAVFAQVLREHPWTRDAAARWWQDFNAAREASAA